MNPLEKMLVVRCERMATQIQKQFIKTQLQLWDKAYKLEYRAIKLSVKRNRPKLSLNAKINIYIKRSKDKEIEFTLTKDQFGEIINGICVYCGRNPAGTIDRINSKKGYIPGNCQSACFRCNMMKYTLSHAEFVNHINKINNYVNTNI